MSTLFSILEMSRRSMQTHQAAIQTNQQNVSNAGNRAYHRQVPIISTTESIEHRGLSGLGRTIHLGTGSALARLDRKRDVFIETQIRYADQRLNQLEEEQKGIQQIEIIFNSLSEDNFNSTVSDFFNAWETLAQDPTDSAFRAEVRTKAQAVAGDLRGFYADLEELQPTFAEDIKIRVDRVNSLLRQLSVIHEDISSVAEPTEAANLLDLRDELVGEIAQLVDVRVIEQDNGTVMIMLDGNPLIQETEVNELKVIPKKPLDGAMDTTTAISEQLVDVVLKQPGQTRDVTIRGGAIAGLLRMQDEIIPQTLKNLDRFAYTFVRQINSVHQSGRGLTGSNGQSLFQFNLPDANGTVSYGTDEAAPPESQPPSRVAATIKMAPEVAGNLNLIATAKGTARGENENALEMVSLQNALFFEEGTLSFTDFYNTSVASLGGLSDENERRVNTTQLVRDQLEARWQSVSGVSLDEELVTMMQYQSIFEAAARMMSTIDQMTDTVINRMAPR